jgi:predicted HicB family RNase H-like nuclease
MAIVTTISTVSARYYEKRNRSVAELNILSMCRALGREPPAQLSQMSKFALVRYALELHAEMPE